MDVLEKGGGRPGPMTLERLPHFCACSQRTETNEFCCRDQRRVPNFRVKLFG